jgi:hypothetical protein
MRWKDIERKGARNNREKKLIMREQKKDRKK